MNYSQNIDITPIKIIQFKDLLEIKFSLNKAKSHARWKSINKDSQITIYLSNLKPIPFLYFIEQTIFYIILEYLCSCIFRGNRFKKNCLDRKHKTKFDIGCIPHHITEKIFRYLWSKDLPTTIRPRPPKNQRLITEFFNEI